MPLTHLSDEDALGLWSKIAIDTGRDWAEVDAWMTVVLDDAVKLGDHAAAGLAALTRGRLRSFQSRFVEASRWLAEAERQFEQEDVFGALAGTRAVQVLVGCAMGAPDVGDRVRALPRGPRRQRADAEPAAVHHAGRGVDALGRRRRERRAGDCCSTPRSRRPRRRSTRGS